MELELFLVVYCYFVGHSGAILYISVNNTLDFNLLLFFIEQQKRESSSLGLGRRSIRALLSPPGIDERDTSFGVSGWRFGINFADILSNEAGLNQGVLCY
jgi:hypothetical protein